MNDDSRDRLIALEVKVQYQSQQLEDLTAEVRKLSSILERAQGAKWILAALWLGFGGAGTAILIKLFSLVGLKMG